jgi:hypothetical protein
MRWASRELVNTAFSLRVPQTAIISKNTERILGYEEEFCSVELRAVAEEPGIG